MKLKQITKILNADVISAGNEHQEFVRAFACDLMSDALVYMRPNCLLLTGLTSLQVIYTASTAGIEAICFVRGKRPPEETIALAKKKNIAILATNLLMFDSCGRLYERGIKGCSDEREL